MAATLPGIMSCLPIQTGDNPIGSCVGTAATQTCDRDEWKLSGFLCSVLTTSFGHRNPAFRQRTEQIRSSPTTSPKRQKTKRPPAKGSPLGSDATSALSTRPGPALSGRACSSLTGSEVRGTGTDMSHIPRADTACWGHLPGRPALGPGRRD